LLDALWVHFSAFVIDDEEMQTRCFEEARELAHPHESRSVFCVGYDVVGYAGAQRELALAQVGSRTRGSNISICREFAHESRVAYRRGSETHCRRPWDLSKSRLWTDATSLF